MEIGTRTSPASVDGAGVFIAYAREDKLFTADLALALESYGFKAIQDLLVLHAGQDWEKTLRKELAGAAAAIFVISQHSLVSEPWADELRIAVEHDKRIVPVIVGPVPIETLPADLRSRHFVDFHAAGRTFAQALVELVRDLRLDLGWHDARSYYANQARTWLGEGKSAAYVLPPEQLAKASHWRSHPPATHKVPPEIAEFLEASEKKRQADDRNRLRQRNRQNILIGALVCMGAAAALFAWGIQEANNASAQRAVPLQAEITRLTNLVAVLREQLASSSSSASAPVEKLQQQLQTQLQEPDLVPYIERLNASDRVVRRGARDDLAFQLQQFDSAEFNRKVIALTQDENASYRTWIGIAQAIAKLGGQERVVKMADREGAIRDLEQLKSKSGMDSALRNAVDAAIKVVQAAVP